MDQNSAVAAQDIGQEVLLRIEADAVAELRTVAAETEECLEMDNSAAAAAAQEKLESNMLVAIETKFGVKEQEQAVPRVPRSPANRAVQQQLVVQN